MAAVEKMGGLDLVRLQETGVLAERLGRMFQDAGTESLMGLKATKRNLFSKDLRKFRHLVFATHGLLGGKVSGLMEPALVLARGDGKERDAFLTLSEAMTLRLNADVVALTACETGVGKQVAGEGVMGMGRAFQYAGAKSVLVSLWSVAEASTTLLVERFFSYLKNGADKVSALRRAREDLLRAGYRHPFFWSPFILIGGGDRPRSEARLATVRRTPERMARVETPRPGGCPAIASRGIISHFVRVKTMGIGGTREGKLTFRNILFETGSATPKKGSRCQLFELGKALSVLTRQRGMKFRIEGHTDSKGSGEYNLALSERRANAVVRFLIENHGLSRESLRAVGLGETRPVATNETAEGGRLNRRVEVALDE